MKTKPKTNIKSPSFYKEAEDMQEGWGKTLRSIDELKDKVQYKKDISLDEYCFILFGEGCCSHQWLQFKKYCVETLKYGDRKMIHDAWEGVYIPWSSDVYDRSNND